MAFGPLVTTLQGLAVKSKITYTLTGVNKSIPYWGGDPNVIEGKLQIDQLDARFENRKGQSRFGPTL
jgi:hypothetical protein